jgi:DNA polymerase-3 subunit beta
VELECEENKMHIRTADSKFEIYGFDPGDYPPVPGFDRKPDLELDGTLLKDMIRKTVFATARESTRYAINGVFWTVRNKELLLVSTDGRRLAMCRHGVGKAIAAFENGVIVPVKAMNMLERSLTEPDMTAAVAVEGNQVGIRTGPVVMTTNLVQGHFPKFEDVIPTDNDVKVSLKLEALHHAVRQAALLTTEESKGIRLAFSKGKLVLSARAPEVGEAEITLEAPYEGEGLEIGFNPQFLVDALRVIEDEEVAMELKESNKPGIIRASGGFLYVVMPVNLA